MDAGGRATQEQLPDDRQLVAGQGLGVVKEVARHTKYCKTSS